MKKVIKIKEGDTIPSNAKYLTTESIIVSDFNNPIKLWHPYGSRIYFPKKKETFHYYEAEKSI